MVLGEISPDWVWPADLGSIDIVIHLAQQAHRSDAPPSSEPEAAVQELASCLRPLVNQLPDEYRDAVTLVDLDGYTNQAAAQQVGVSTSGMKSRVQRGRKKLAALLHDCCVIDAHGGTIDDYTPRAEVCPCNADPATGSVSN